MQREEQLRQDRKRKGAMFGFIALLSGLREMRQSTKARMGPVVQLLLFICCSLALLQCSDKPKDAPSDVEATFEYEYVRQDNFNITDDEYGYGINWVNLKIYDAKLWIKTVDERRMADEDSLLWINKMDWWDTWIDEHTLPSEFDNAFRKHKRHLFSVRGFCREPGQSNSQLLKIWGLGPKDDSPWDGHIWIAYIAATHFCDIPDMVMASTLVHELGHDLGALEHRCTSPELHVPDVGCVMAEVACAKCPTACEMKRTCTTYEEGWVDNPPFYSNHRFCAKCIENLGDHLYKETR